MNRAERISEPFAEALAALLVAAYERVRGAAHAREEARKRAESARQLRALSDHLLRDIGLHRSQLDSAVFGAWPRR
jgi:uncharacterized protein YjiS (DUF1127 family)